MDQIFDKTPVTQTIARQLQEMIRSGELKKDGKLPSQRVLSERLKVSRASLREAILTLETLGLVRTYPARGTFVVGPETRQPARQNHWRYQEAYSITDVFQSRLLIETELCRLAALEISDEQIADLESANAVFETAWNEGDLVAHVEADLSFHKLIADACPNRMLQTLYQSVQDLLTESQRQPIPNTAKERMEASISEHVRVLNALRQRNPDAAAYEMRQHILNTARCAGAQI